MNFLSRETGYISLSTAFNPFAKMDTVKIIVKIMKHITSKFYTGTLNRFPFLLCCPFSAFWLRLSIDHNNQPNEMLGAQDEWIRLDWIGQKDVSEFILLFSFGGNICVQIMDKLGRMSVSFFFLFFSIISASLKNIIAVCNCSAPAVYLGKENLATQHLALLNLLATKISRLLSCHLPLRRDKVKQLDML